MLSLDTLNVTHWTVLLRFAKGPRRLFRPLGLLRLRTEPKLRPQRACLVHPPRR